MISIPITIFVIFALSRSYLQLKSNTISVRQFIFWLVIWSAVLVIVYWPNVSDKIASYLGIQRGVDVFVYFGLVGLFYLVFRVIIKLEEVEREITRIVREIALRKIEK